MTEVVCWSRKKKRARTLGVLHDVNDYQVFLLTLLAPLVIIFSQAIEKILARTEIMERVNDYQTTDILWARAFSALSRITCS